VTIRISDLVQYPTAPPGVHRIIASFFVKVSAVEWGYISQAYDLSAPAPTFRQITAARFAIAERNEVDVNNVQFLAWSPLA
jgi:hypothetical protein